jgi:hypothetical protein
MHLENRYNIIKHIYLINKILIPHFYNIWMDKKKLVGSCMKYERAQVVGYHMVGAIGSDAAWIYILPSML